MELLRTPCFFSLFIKAVTFFRFSRTIIFIYVTHSVIVKAKKPEVTKMKAKQFQELTFNQRMTFICGLCEAERKRQQRQKLGTFYEV